MNEATSKQLLPLLIVVLGVALEWQDAAGQTSTEQVDRIQRQVEALALASGIEGRRSAIVDRITSMGLESRLHWFEPPAGVPGVDRRGANVTAQLSRTGRPVLLLGAHYDDFGRGQGVIDNAAGVAVVLELAQALLKDPLRNFDVAIALFDLEEDGRLGSRAMVADSLQVPLPAVFLNFDIFGYGDGMWIGAPRPDGLLPRLIQEQGTSAGLEVVIDSLYPSSDHVSYRNTRTESFGISLLDASDIHVLLARFRAPTPTIGETPRIFTIMHTSEDTLDKLDAAAVSRGIRVVEQAVRDFDARSTSSQPYETTYKTGWQSNVAMQQTGWQRSLKGWGRHTRLSRVATVGRSSC
jgi:aminopeptidase S